MTTIMREEKADEIINALRDGHVFDENDLGNLEFLLKASPEVLEDWSNQMGEEDLEYAREILVEANHYFDSIHSKLDVTEAATLIKGFML